MTEDEIRALLEKATAVAVVGASTDSAKPAFRIPKRLIEAGFEVIPVNPSVAEVHGRTAYPSLLDIPEPIHIVDVFRPAAEAPGIARAAVAVGATALWLQSGIRSAQARALAEEAGLDYVEDRCIGQMVRRLDIRK